MITSLSSLILPIIVMTAGLIILLGGNKYFDAFLKGAKEGLISAVNLLPTLTALLVAVYCLSASGITELAAKAAAPFAEKIGIPPDLLPLLLTRPFSGSAGSAAFINLLSVSGADSFTAFCAAVIMGSSDTMMYVLSVYFAASGSKKTRYAFPAAAIVMLFSVFFSCAVSRIFYSQ